MANVIKELAEIGSICLVFPSGVDNSVPEFISEFHVIPHTTSNSRTFSLRPRLGQNMLAGFENKLSELLRDFEPDCVYWTHSYLPAAIPDIFQKVTGKSVVEFANIEGRRFRSLAGTVSGKAKVRYWLESVKAKIWEPRIARSAKLAVALSALDKAQLDNWNASAIMAANGLNFSGRPSSPQNNYLLIFASMGYLPNSHSTLTFLNEVWPAILARYPNLRLVLAGRAANKLDIGNAQSVDVVSDPPNQEELYQGCIATVVPTLHGGGSQLKVTESLQRQRLCLVSSYTWNTSPDNLKNYLGGFIANDANQYLEQLEKVVNYPTRSELESAIPAAISTLEWDETLAPLIKSIKQFPLNRS